MSARLPYQSTSRSRTLVDSTTGLSMMSTSQTRYTAEWWSCWQSVGNGVQSVSLTQSADLSVYGCCTVGHAVVGISASWHILAPMQGRLAGRQGPPQTRFRKVSNVYKTVGNLFCSLQNNTIIVIHWLVHIYMHMCVKKNPPRFSAIFSERLRISKIK